MHSAPVLGNPPKGLSWFPPKKHRGFNFWVLRAARTDQVLERVRKQTTSKTDRIFPKYRSMARLDGAELSIFGLKGLEAFSRISLQPLAFPIGLPQTARTFAATPTNGNEHDVEALSSTTPQAHRARTRRLSGHRAGTRSHRHHHLWSTAMSMLRRSPARHRI